ncbi:N-acetylmuramoyl-L-alanine amidase [Peribacillus sp. SCS-37]|uniref:N-acetylmuramoyl-L-alanine amidase n=1 Tax=Paraperibacillus esterisolvens TaxID=3115296 RepID=UPI003905A374
MNKFFSIFLSLLVTAAASAPSISAEQPATVLGAQSWAAGWAEWGFGAAVSLKGNETRRIAEVAADTLRIRSGPGAQSGIIGKLSRGTRVEIKDQNDKWFRIQIGTLTGWAAAEFLKEEHGVTSPAGGSAVSLIDYLNVRTSPSTSASIIGSINRGETAVVTRLAGDWLEIEYKGEAGWISREYARLEQGSKSVPAEDEDNEELPPSSTAVIQADSLQVRSQPSLEGKAVGTIYKGSSYSILDKENGWIKLQYEQGKKGWAAGWFTLTSGDTQHAAMPGNIKIKILYDRTNLRKSPDSSGKIVKRAREGEIYKVSAIQGNWYEVLLKDENRAYVPGWMADRLREPVPKKTGKDKFLKHKVIVIDPGHGGRDRGTTGTGGTFEKDVTLWTALLVYDRLRAAGADVILTRTLDTFIELDARVDISHLKNADAFISIHYDSADGSDSQGFTSFYNYGNQKTLAEELHSSLASLLPFPDRGIRQENYHVIRENKQPAVLLELGYLSNPAEELAILDSSFQKQAASAIFDGLASYFKNQAQN